MYAMEECADAWHALALAPHRAEMAQAIVAHVFDVTIDEIRAAKRGAPRAALARQVAMYLSHIVFGMSVNQVAAAFMRHRSTAHHALRHVEDLRDDPQIDRALSVLETTLLSAAGGPA